MADVEVVTDPSGTGTPFIRATNASKIVVTPKPGGDQFTISVDDDVLLMVSSDSPIKLEVGGPIPTGGSSGPESTKLA